jgi:NADH dehydrogenase/NADH:ubiquinone oxidoreductase subunit G
MVNIKRSICLFCSLGCGVAFRTNGDKITAVDYDKENPINAGSICPRGYYNFELLNHPGKLTDPYIGERKATWADANCFIKDRIKESNPHNVAILLSSNATNEDAFMAAKMAKDLGTKNISCGGDRADIEAFQGFRWGAPSIHRADVTRLGNFDALLIVGDLLTRSPVLSKKVNQVKYGKRGNQVIVIDPNVTHTTWFATNHLKNNPGTEAALLAGILKVISEENKIVKVDVDLDDVAKVTGISKENIIRAAKAFDSAENGCVVFVPGREKQRNDLIQYLVNQIAAGSLEKKHITFFSYGNTLGANTVLDCEVPDHIPYPELFEKARRGELETVFLFGEDHADIPAKFLVKSVFFKSTHVGETTVQLPLASYMERKGNLILAGGRKENLVPIAHKVGGRAIWKIISSIMDYNIPFSELITSAAAAIEKCAPIKEMDIKHAITEAMALKPKDKAEMLNITHFGNNELVKNFFWYKVNN